MDMVEVVARAICLKQFGSAKHHGDWRCCQTGGTRGCTVEDGRETAEFILEAINKAMREQHERSDR
jgi:hypothetical protein